MPINKTSNKPLEHQYTNDSARGGAATFILLLDPEPGIPCLWGDNVVADYPRDVVDTSPAPETAVTIDGKSLSDWRDNPTDLETGLNDFYGKRTASIYSNQ